LINHISAGIAFLIAYYAFQAASTAYEVQFLYFLAAVLCV
jgi:hypothetical protein